jgi:hypothetical protein
LKDKSSPRQAKWKEKEGDKKIRDDETQYAESAKENIPLAPSI